jgi:hypothetical protein
MWWVMDIGSLVRIKDEESPWHNEIAIVREINEHTGARRIELLGKLVWKPPHVLEPYDEFFEHSE